MVASIILCLLLSLGMTGMMFLAYFRSHTISTMVWAFAWLIMSLRLYIVTIASLGYLAHTIFLTFLNDVMLITTDFLWVIGVCLFLKTERSRRELIIMVYVIYLLLIGSLFLIPNGPVFEHVLIGEIITLLIVHPAFLIFLFWRFYRSGVEVKNTGMQILGIAFLIWAADFIIFGIPYFVYRDILSGAIGWTIGVIFRVLMIVGFLMMIDRKRKEDQTQDD